MGIGKNISYLLSNYHIVWLKTVFALIFKVSTYSVFLFTHSTLVQSWLIPNMVMQKVFFLALSSKPIGKRQYFCHSKTECALA